MGGVFSSYTTDDNILTLWSWCQRLENEINTINARTNQGNNSQTEGSSADFQSLSRRFDDFNKENSRVREDITALSAKIDENIAKISHWEGALEVLPGKFHDALTAEVNTMNAKYQALSIRVENGFHDSPPAINRGLALGLSLGLGIPLTIALIFLCAVWIRRKYPYIPQHANNEEAENYIKIHKATRQKTLTEKLCDLFEALDFKKKQVVPEVYVMDNTPKKG
ncbi:uncharacterized protein N7518_003773 [Penicillium psychrosexuale]|uniref:uncharacterized protein n=1 Tax=Penicillium psychrosexuale TaxID=1002107 RepID=UPI0025451D10|nr:uncharacterized protein N7518_003773 [Penicillium psychrosexuale]KAJ5801705.1 hypothetical protein N7518_003773 [Penicillium psychrosexuale]